MIYLRIYEQDAACHRRLVGRERFADWGSAIVWLTSFAQQRVGIVYEIEEYAGTPGDPDGE